jgi:hypothetical protein
MSRRHPIVTLSGHENIDELKMNTKVLTREQFLIVTFPRAV